MLISNPGKHFTKHTCITTLKLHNLKRLNQAAHEMCIPRNLSLNIVQFRIRMIARKMETSRNQTRIGIEFREHEIETDIAIWV
jgi:hypothetical protein